LFYCNSYRTEEDRSLLHNSVFSIFLVKHYAQWFPPIEVSSHFAQSRIRLVIQFRVLKKFKQDKLNLGTGNIYG